MRRVAAPYLAVLSSRFRMLLQYRAVAVAGIATQLFFGLIRVMIFDAFYQSTKVAQPLSAGQTTTYIWLGQAFLLLVMFGPDAEIAGMIDTGHVAYELTRPTDLYFLWYFRCLAGRAAPVALRSLPIFFVAGMFFRMGAPVSFEAAVLFVVSIFLGLLLSAALVTLVSLSMLWTISGQGAAALAPPLIFMASGILIPLPLLPGWLQGTMNALPFRGLIDTPFRIYLGSLTGGAAGMALLHQLLWIGGVVLAGRAMLSRGLHRLVVQGG